MFARSLWLLAAIASITSARSAMPVNYGMIVFPAFTNLDVFGPLDILNRVASSHPMNLSIIASTLAPVSTATNHTEHFSQSIVPTHTFKHPPKELDVLIVPGGVGSTYEAPALLDAIAYIKHEYPRLQYVISVCTGATLLARAGVLDGKNATTNKQAWAWATSQGPKVHWVPVARWVVDGNIWTTSGVAAGMDGVYAFVDMLYGENYTSTVANGQEYERHTNSSWDPYSAIFNVPGSS